MKKKQVIIELLPNRIEVVRSGGRAGDSRRVTMALDSSEPRDWVRAVRKTTGSLRAAVKEISAEGADALVLYRSPTHAIDLASLKIKGAEAREAAKLECLDALSHAPTDVVCASVEIAKDAESTHVVAAAERDDIADTIVRLVEDAGLKFVSATPINAAMLASLVRGQLKAGKGLQARLYIGDNASFFVVVDQGNLVFARQITIGLGAIAASLERPIQRGGGQEPLTLTHDEARHILHTHGRPGWKDVIDEERGLTGDKIGPMMQSVLQRFIVELRQSLRFGMTTEQRESLSILLTGPGSSVPGFAALIADELSVEIEADAAYESFDWKLPGGRGSELRDASSDLRLLRTLNMLPVEIAARRADSRLKRWLWTGAAAAIAVMGVDAGRLHLKLSDARGQMSAIEAQVAGQEQLAATSERLIAMISSTNALQDVIARETEGQPAMRAVLHELSSLTPGSIRLTSITVDCAGADAVGTVGGFAFEIESESDRPESDLEAFIASVGRSPLVDEITLGNVLLSELGDRPGEQFSARFTLHAAPRPAEDAVAAAPEEATP